MKNKMNSFKSLNFILTSGDYENSLIAVTFIDVTFYEKKKSFLFFFLFCSKGNDENKTKRTK